MAHKYAAIEDNGIALERIRLSTISEHDSESLYANGETNGHIDEEGDRESDFDGLSETKERRCVRGRKSRGRIWICCVLFIGVLVFSLLFSILFLVLARWVVPEYFGATQGGENGFSGEGGISWLGWEEIRYMFVLYVPESLGPRIRSPVNCIAPVSCTVLRYSFEEETNCSGDSYSSVGYNVDGDHPSVDNVIGNPAFPGKTTSLGYNWVKNLPSP